jgi:hypothetical protein
MPAAGQPLAVSSTWVLSFPMKVLRGTGDRAAGAALQGLS